MILGLLSLLGLHLLATMSPGPDFAIVLKNALGRSRRNGIFSALGIFTSNLIHWTLVFTGLSFLFSRWPQLKDTLFLAGGIYLCYLGIKTFLASLKQKTTSAESAKPVVASKISFWEGFFTSILNAKAIFYMSALLSSALSYHLKKPVLILFILLLTLVSLSWFSLLAWIIGIPKLRRRLESSLVSIDRICAAFFLIVGAHFVWDFLYPP